MKPLHYLACPIKHADSTEVQRRYEYVSAVMVDLALHGWMVYSPFNHWYPHSLKMPREWSFWEEPSFAHLDRCDAVIVLKLDGWDLSQGVAAEIHRAVLQRKPVLYVSYALQWDGDSLVVDEWQPGRRCGPILSRQ